MTSVWEVRAILIAPAIVGYALGWYNRGRHEQRDLTKRMDREVRYHYRRGFGDGLDAARRAVTREHSRNQADPGIHLLPPGRTGA